MNEAIAFSDLNGLKLSRVALLPGRALTLTLFGLREDRNGGHFHSEVVLQFNQISDIQITGKLAAGSGLVAEDAIKELSSKTGLRKYRISLDGAKLDVSARNHVCWYVRNDRLPADESKSLGKYRRETATGAGKLRRAKKRK